MKASRPADSNRRQAEGLSVREAVPGLVVLQRGALLVAQEMQVSGDGAPRDAELAQKSLLLGR